MKTRSWSQTAAVLGALNSLDGWAQASTLGMMVCIPPEKIHRESARAARRHERRGQTENASRSSLISNSASCLTKSGFVESRINAVAKREYRITDKGREHLAKINAKSAKASSG